MSLITASRLSSAIIYPSKICALSCALRNSYCVRRTTTSCRNSTNSEIRCFKFKILGLPFTRATLFIPKEVCSSEYLYNWFITTCAMVSFFSSTTTLVPSLLLLSLFTSLTPSMILSWIRSPIFCVRESLFTW